MKIRFYFSAFLCLSLTTFFAQCAASEAQALEDLDTVSDEVMLDADTKQQMDRIDTNLFDVRDELNNMQTELSDKISSLENALTKIEEDVANLNSMVLDIHKTSEDSGAAAAAAE